MKEYFEQMQEFPEFTGMYSAVLSLSSSFFGFFLSLLPDFYFFQGLLYWIFSHLICPLWLAVLCQVLNVLSSFISNLLPPYLFSYMSSNPIYTEIDQLTSFLWAFVTDPVKDDQKERTPRGHKLCHMFCALLLSDWGIEHPNDLVEISLRDCECLLSSKDFIYFKIKKYVPSLMIFLFFSPNYRT